MCVIASVPGDSSGIQTWKFSGPDQVRDTLGMFPFLWGGEIGGLLKFGDIGAGSRVVLT